MNYSFQKGVKLAILTNGLSWWFYLPFREGNWEEKKFYTIEIYDQESKDIVQKFEDFLSKENVISDIAINKAENLYKSRQKSNLIKETLPMAWEKIITEPDETLIDLLADTTERLCGYRPDNKAVEYFLMKIAQVYLTSDLIPDLLIEIYSENIESKDIQNDSKCQIYTNNFGNLC